MCWQMIELDGAFEIGDRVRDWEGFEGEVYAVGWADRRQVAVYVSLDMGGLHAYIPDKLVARKPGVCA